MVFSGVVLPAGGNNQNHLLRKGVVRCPLTCTQQSQIDRERSDLSGRLRQLTKLVFFSQNQFASINTRAREKCLKLFAAAKMQTGFMENVSTKSSLLVF